MTVDPKNNGTIIGGLVADPELVNDGKIAKFRLAVDYAGKDAANPDNRSGYFDVVMYKNDDQNSKFVFGQISDGKMKKGSQVAVAYRLNHSRWQADDGTGRSRVELTAEAMTYVGGGRKEDSDSEGGSNDQPSATSANTQGSVPSKF